MQLGQSKKIFNKKQALEALQFMFFAGWETNTPAFVMYEFFAPLCRIFKIKLNDIRLKHHNNASLLDLRKKQSDKKLLTKYLTEAKEPMLKVVEEHKNNPDAEMAEEFSTIKFWSKINTKPFRKKNELSNFDKQKIKELTSLLILFYLQDQISFSTVYALIAACCIQHNMRLAELAVLEEKGKPVVTLMDAVLRKNDKDAIALLKEGRDEHRCLAVEDAVLEAVPAGAPNLPKRPTPVGSDSQSSNHGSSNNGHYVTPPSSRYSPPPSDRDDFSFPAFAAPADEAKGKEAAVPADTLPMGDSKGGERYSPPLVQAKALLSRSSKTGSHSRCFSAGMAGKEEKLPRLCTLSLDEIMERLTEVVCAIRNDNDDGDCVNSADLLVEFLRTNKVPEKPKVKSDETDWLSETKVAKSFTVDGVRIHVAHVTSSTIRMPSGCRLREPIPPGYVGKKIFKGNEKNKLKGGKQNPSIGKEIPVYDLSRFTQEPKTLKQLYAFLVKEAIKHGGELWGRLHFYRSGKFVNDDSHVIAFYVAAPKDDEKQRYKQLRKDLDFLNKDPNWRKIKNHPNWRKLRKKSKELNELMKKHCFFLDPQFIECIPGQNGKYRKELENPDEPAVFHDLAIAYEVLNENDEYNPDAPDIFGPNFFVMIDGPGPLPDVQLQPVERAPHNPRLPAMTPMPAPTAAPAFLPVQLPAGEAAASPGFSMSAAPSAGYSFYLDPDRPLPTGEGAIANPLLLSINTSATSSLSEFVPEVVQELQLPIGPATENRGLHNDEKEAAMDTGPNAVARKPAQPIPAAVAEEQRAKILSDYHIYLRRLQMVQQQQSNHGLSQSPAPAAAPPKPNSQEEGFKVSLMAQRIERQLQKRRAQEMQQQQQEEQQQQNALALPLLAQVAAGEPPMEEALPLTPR